MPENIVWAHPEKTTCYSFEGRLYQTKATAMVQWRHRVNTKANAILIAKEQENEQKLNWWTNRQIAPVYEITWDWRELDDEEYKP